MSKLIIIGLLFLCAENAYLDWHYDHIGDTNKMVGYTRKQVASMDALVARSMGDAAHRKAADSFRNLPKTSPTQQIASLWNITPQDMRSKVDIFGEVRQ